MRLRVERWGKSLGVRVPRRLAARLGIGEGSRVELIVEGDRVAMSVARPVYSLDELLVGTTPRAMHDAFAWDDDVGREVVE